MGFEERYMDVLQNMEAAIIDVYRRRPELLDVEVDAALEALVAHYTAVEGGRTPRPVSLQGARREVYDGVAEICQWRLGDPADAVAGEMGPPLRATSAGEIVACLKRLRKSVQRITKEGGRQGYLKFISRFM